MKTIFEGYKTIETGGKPTFFAGANTASGFVGDYGNIADENKLERVYVIKGGSGTGKSTLMRRCAAEAEKAGVPVIRWLCGSDPDSLDCVVLDNRIAVLDGTAPHVRDMVYPGASSELIDVSRFWDSAALEKDRDAIVEHAARKTACYASAYRYLAAAELLEREKSVCTSALFLREKAEACIDRLLKKLGKPVSKNAAVREIRTHALTMKGAFVSDSLGMNAAHRYTVTDAFGCAVPFMRLLTEKLTAAGYSLTAARLPVPDVISGIFIEDCGVCIEVGQPEGNDSVINMQRFIISDFPDGVRGEFRLASKIQQSCIDEALRQLAKASEEHFTIEQIYIRAMDFASLGAYTDTVVDKISTRLGIK